MYSYEDRIRAVKLYIKLGKRLRATIRQLGYPTKNSLIGWYREYEQAKTCESATRDVQDRNTPISRSKLR
jgi:transposase-like protein